MTSTFRLCGLCVMIVIAIVASRFVGATQEQRQEQRRNVKRAVVERQFHPKTVLAPVRIHDLMVGKQARALGKSGATVKGLAKKFDPSVEFEADSNSFVESIRFDVSNRSNKTIKFIRFNIYFFTQLALDTGEDPTGGKAIAIMFFDYGHFPMPKDSPSEVPLRPGRTATMAIDSVSPQSLANLHEGIAKMNGEIVRVGILVNTVTFEDGSEWYFDGKTVSGVKGSGLMHKPVDIGDSTQVAEIFAFRANACGTPTLVPLLTFPRPFLTILPVVFFCTINESAIPRRL